MISAMPYEISAAVCRRFGAPLSVETLILDDPGPDELIVSLEAVAICHSDVLYADGAWGGELPAVYGHEAVGRVETTGSGVDLVPGERVVVTLIRSCGRCRDCRRGLAVVCRERFALDDRVVLRDRRGAAVVQGLRTAGFAERVLVHRSQVAVIDTEVPAPAAALLGCGVLTGVGAVLRTARVEAGSSVVVIGCGGVGLNVVQGAVLAAASPIIAVDPVADKRDLAVRLGATHTVDPTDGGATAAVHEVLSGGADYVFIATGAAGAFGESPGLLGPAGVLVIVGMPPSEVMMSVDPGALAGANQTILGSKMGSSVVERDIADLVAAHHRGDLALDVLVSATYSLDDIDAALDGVRRGSARRNVIVFGS